MEGISSSDMNEQIWEKKFMHEQKWTLLKKMGFYLEVEDQYSASKVRVDIACIKIHAWTKNELFEKKVEISW